MTNKQPEALPAIQRFEVVDCIDDKHVPAVIPKPHGPWVRYEDHIAALAGGQATAAQQGVDNAALPTHSHTGRVYEEGFLIGTCPLYTADQMRAFADATHALRVSHGQAPAQAAPAAVTGPSEAVAYLDIGTGGYLDIGTDLTDEALSRLPKGRHALVIAGTYGIDGYTAAPTTRPAPQQEAQDPCPTCAALARTVMLDQASFDRKPNCYGIRQITDDEGVEEWEDIRTSPDVAREEANYMMATGRGEIFEVVPLWTTPQPSPTAQAAESVPAVGRGQERIAFKDAHRHLELDEVLDAWARPMFKHSHVEASWLGWIARAARAPADSVLEDAARYRWLREGNDAKHSAAWHVAVNLYGCEWDAAIDAARKQEANHD